MYKDASVQIMLRQNFGMMITKLFGTPALITSKSNRKR